MSTLTIISHTEHYRLNDGTIVGWGPTVNEINHLLDVFDTIYHIAMLYDTHAPESSLAYTSNDIQFVALPSLGGKTVASKFQLICKAPEVISQVAKYINKSDYFQLRTPTGIGVYLIPYLTIQTNHKGWYKYAGNWNQTRPPVGYAIQRWLLKLQSRPVTINGSWPKQPKHCITFENPCLTADDIVKGNDLAQKRILPTRWNFCYVGRLEDDKGVSRILEVLDSLPDDLKIKVGTVHMVGDGMKRQEYEVLASETGIMFKFHGFLPRNEVFEIYRHSDVFLMPTQASEGFPKVIAEAMNFGCLPMVSDVSAIGQYIKHGVNGYIIKGGTTEETISLIYELFKKLNTFKYKQLVAEGRELVESFTYSAYNQKICQDIIKIEKRI